MTICHITSMHEYNDDRIFERACKGLSSIGNNVKLIAAYPGNSKVEGIEIFGLKKREGLKRRVFSSFEAFRKAKKISADVFHFHDPDLIPWMLLLSFSGKNVVYDVHENYESRVSKFFQKIYRRIENLFASGYAGVTVVTESMKSLFNGIEKPIAVTDNVVYLERLKNVNIIFQKEKKYTIYTSGTNSFYRNCIETLEALPLILKEIPEVNMKFVGRYHPENFKQQMIEKAREMEISDYVSIEGMISWEENFKRTAKAHIGCVFYQDNPNNRVTLPNRLYEYLFCKVAVLGEDFPEVRRVLEDTGAGLCVNSNNPESIAEKAVYLLKNPEIMLNMGERGRKAVIEKYNFENSLNELMRFYSQIINK